MLSSLIKCSLDSIKHNNYNHCSSNNIAFINSFTDLLKEDNPAMIAKIVSNKDGGGVWPLPTRFLYWICLLYQLNFSKRIHKTISLTKTKSINWYFYSFSSLFRKRTPKLNECDKTDVTHSSIQTASLGSNCTYVVEHLDLDNFKNLPCKIAG